MYIIFVYDGSRKSIENNNYQEKYLLHQSCYVTMPIHVPDGLYCLFNSRCKGMKTTILFEPYT